MLVVDLPSPLATKRERGPASKCRYSGRLIAAHTLYMVENDDALIY